MTQHHSILFQLTKTGVWFFLVNSTAVFETTAQLSVDI